MGGGVLLWALLGGATHSTVLSGAVGAGGLTVIYCLVRFHGLRRLGRRAG